MKKLLALLLSVAMLAALAPLAIAEEAIDTSEHVNLRMLMLGTKQADHELVWSEISKLAERDLNASITTDVLDMADQETKYSLILASGEPYDIIFTANWAHYDTEAPKGAFIEINEEVIKKYLPETYAQQPMEYLDHNRIGDGKVYLVPQNFVNLAGTAITIREDLREKYNVPDVTDLASLEVYLDAIKANEPGMFPYAITQENQYLKNVAFNDLYEVVNLNGNPISYFFVFPWKAGMTTEEAAAAVQYIGDMPEYKEFATLANRWAEKGFWSRSAIADATAIRDSYENGQSALFIQNTGTMGVANNALRGKDMKPKMIDIMPDAPRFMGLSQAGMAVPANSKNQERALMFIDKLKFDIDYYGLYRWGIENTHWLDAGDRMWTSEGIEEGQARYVYGQGSWGFSNVHFEKDRVGADPESLVIWRRWRAENEQTNPLVNFTFNVEPVANEIAALTNVRAQHLYLIDLGLAGDVDAAIDAMNAAAEAAGLAKIKEEMQKQLEAFLAAQ